MVMELPKNRDEWGDYQNTILSSKGGSGTIYTGGYYHLIYQPYTRDTKSLKCEGVVLTILRNADNKLEDFAPVIVMSNEEIGIIDSLNGKVSRPFKERVKFSVADMVQKIKDHDEHTQRVKETAEKVVKCKFKIDDLMSEITEGASVPLSRMIEEREAKALPEGSSPVEPEDHSINPKKIHSIVTDLERINRASGTNVVLDEVAQGKRASEMILNGAKSGMVMDAHFRVVG